MLRVIETEKEFLEFLKKSVSFEATQVFINYSGDLIAHGVDCEAHAEFGYYVDNDVLHVTSFKAYVRNFLYDTAEVEFLLAIPELVEKLTKKETEEKKQEETSVKIEISVTVTDEVIDIIMFNALDGGVDGWCKKVEVVGDCLAEYADYQISRGGQLKFSNEDGEEFILDKEKLLKGIEYACAQYGIVEVYYGGFCVDVNCIDEDVAGEIVQYALFGEVLYS